MLICVFGRRGSGKTTLIRHLIPRLKKPVVVVDILGNYSEGGPYEIADAEHTYEVADTLRAILAYRSDPDNEPGIITLISGDISHATDFVCSALWHGHGGTLVLDEADAITIADAPCFDEAVRYGRNRGIDIITGCRRPAEISKNITAGADLVYCLSTSEPNDLKYYREYLGEDETERLAQCPQYHGVFRNFKTQETGTFKTDKKGRVTVLTRMRLTQDTQPTRALPEQEREKNSRVKPAPAQISDSSSP